MAAVAQGQARTVFAVGDAITWSQETLRIISSLPIGFLAEMVKKAGAGPFIVKAINPAITVCKDGDFAHPQILQIKDSNDTGDWFSGVFFEKQEVKQANAELNSPSLKTG